jgi:hypothetical protein
MDHGYELIGRARLTNDALICCTARRVGASIVTANLQDLLVLAPYLPAPVLEAPRTA